MFRKLFFRSWHHLVRWGNDLLTLPSRWHAWLQRRLRTAAVLRRRSAQLFLEKLEERLTPSASPTSTELDAVSATQLIYGQQASLKVTVTSTDPGTPSGSVQWLEDGVLLATTTLDAGGTTTFQTSSVDVGIPSFTADFVGNSDWDASDSNSLGFTIDPATLTITPSSGQSKIYGSADPTLTYSSSGFVNGDSSSILSGALDRVVGENVGSYAIDQDSLSAGNNYTISLGTGSFSITPAPLTISAVSDSKTYDSFTTSLLVPMVSGLASWDTMGGMDQAFTSPNVRGTNGSTLTVTDYTILGLGSANYTVTLVDAAGTISPAPLTISATSDSKYYDASTDSLEMPTISGILGGDTVTNLTQAFASKDVLGTNGSTLAVTDYTINDGNGGNNYSVSLVSAQGTISPYGLMLNDLEAEDKVYDGSTTATLDTSGVFFDGVFSGDTVSLDPSNAVATFDSKDAGDYIPVTITGLALTGPQAADYRLPFPPYSTSASITPRTLTVSGITAQDKVYDNTTNATLNFSYASLGGLIGSDSVSLDSSAASGTFASKDVGTGITVTVSGLYLSGAQSSDYQLPAPVQASTTASITPATLTVRGITAEDKVYDGTTAAILDTSYLSLAGIFSGDAVSPDASAIVGTFASKDAGTGIVVTVSGLDLTGTDAADYKLPTPQFTTTATITPRTLTVSGITAATRVYNGTTNAVLNTASASLSGVLAGDSVSLAVSGAAGTFASKDAGSGILVTISGLSLSGADAADYQLPAPQFTTTASILPYTLTVNNLVAQDKVYDGTTSATLDGSNVSLVGLFSGDSVSLDISSAVATFASKDVGSGISVTVTGLALSGPQAGDYQLTGLPYTTSASITPRTLSVSGITAQDKVYDSTTNATLDCSAASLVGVLSGDSVSLDSSGASGTFVSKDAGTGITVTVSGLYLSGAQSGDYQLPSPAQASTTASVTPASITVSGLTAEDKAYDGTTVATLVTSGIYFNGVFSGDSVSLDASSAVATFASKDVGSGISVTVTGLALSGPQAGDYQLTGLPYTTSASITPRTLTVSGITAADKYYDGTTSATLDCSAASLVGVLSGDSVSLDSSAAAGTFATPNVGSGILVTVSGLALSGAQKADYQLPTPQATTTADILSVPAPSLNGLPFAAARGQCFTGPVASFQPAQGASTSSYSAVILWGDGSSSPGTISSVDGDYQVSGSHTYAAEGPYVVGVELSGVGGTQSATLTLGLVLALTPDSVFETLGSWTLTTTASQSGDSSSDDGSHTLAESGTLSTSLQSTVYGVGTTVSANDSVWLSFTESGTVSVSASVFALDSYSSTATGTASDTLLTFSNDLVEEASGTVSSTPTVLWTGTGDGSSGDFSWTHGESASNVTTTEQGNSGSGTFTSTATEATASTTIESGNFAAGTFTATETDSSSGTTNTTTTDWGSTVTLTTSDSSGTTTTEAGALGGDLTATVIRSDSSSGRGAGSDPGGTFTETPSSSDSSTATVTASVATGAFTETVSNATSGAADSDTGEEETLDGYNFSDDPEVGWNSLLTGNTQTGSYSSTETDLSNSTGTDTDTDQGSLTTSTDYDFGTTTTLETGNAVSGDETQTVYQFDNATGIETNTDQNSTSTGTDYDFGSSTTQENGNYFGGDQTATVYQSNNATGIETDTDQQASSASTDYDHGSSTTLDIANLISGDDDATTTQYDNDTTPETDTDQDSSSSSTTYDTGNSTTTDTSNVLSGAQSHVVYQFDNATTSETDTDQQSSTTSTTFDFGSSTTLESGNFISGVEDPTTYQFDNATTYETDTDQQSSSNSTSYDTSTSTQVEADNPYTGTADPTTYQNNNVTTYETDTDQDSSSKITTFDQSSSTTIEAANLDTGSANPTTYQFNDITTLETDTDQQTASTSTTSDFSSTTTLETANLINGSVTPTTYQFNDVTTFENDTDQDSTSSITTYDYSSTTTLETANLINGSVTPNTYQFNDVMSIENDTDQDSSSISTSYDTSSSTTLQTANLINGSVTPTTYQFKDVKTTETDTEQNSSTTSTTYDFSSTTTLETANLINGSVTPTTYQFNDVTTFEVGTDQDANSTSTTYDFSSTTTLASPTNLISGTTAPTTYQFSDVTTLETGTDQSSSSTSTSYDFSTSTTLETANLINGSLYPSTYAFSNVTTIESSSDQGATDGLTSYDFSSSTTLETGNIISGSDDTTTFEFPNTTTYENSTDQGKSDDSSTTVTGSSTTIATANDNTGVYSSTSNGTTTATTIASGSDARGSFSGNSNSTTTTTATDSGNSWNGTDTLGQTSTTWTSASRSGGDSDTTYSETSTDTSTSVLQQNSNSDTGDVTSTITDTDVASLVETGTYLANSTGYTIHENDNDSSTVTQTANEATGSDNQATTTSATTTLLENGSNSSGSYDFTDTVTGSSTVIQSGNDDTGTYSNSGNDSTTTVIEESNSFSAGSSTFTETISGSNTTSETGNSLTGDYTHTITGTTTTSLDDDASNASGSSTVTSSDTNTTTTVETGNHISGGYSSTLTGNDSYTVTQSGSDSSSSYTWIETGANGSSGTETGNRVLGTYTRDTSGTDGYTINENGTNSGGGFTETVSGSDSWTLAETGNTPNQAYNRTETGSGSDTLSDTGAGATISSGSSSYGYTAVEGGSVLAGCISQAETGSDRYDLLQDFNNVADTEHSSGPGHLNLVPYGVAFVDPSPVDVPEEYAAPKSPNMKGDNTALKATLQGQISQLTADIRTFDRAVLEARTAKIGAEAEARVLQRSIESTRKMIDNEQARVDNSLKKMKEIEKHLQMFPFDAKARDEYASLKMQVDGSSRSIRNWDTTKQILESQKLVAEGRAKIYEGNEFDAETKKQNAESRKRALEIELSKLGG